MNILHFAEQGGMYILQMLDWYAASVSVISICLVEAIVVGWTYGNQSQFWTNILAVHDLVTYIYRVQVANNLCETLNLCWVKRFIHGGHLPGNT